MLDNFISRLTPIIQELLPRNIQERGCYMPNKKDNVTAVFALFLLFGLAAWYIGVLAKTDRMYKKLSSIDGVISVEKVDLEKKYGSSISSKYLVTFSQPIDWNNPEAGSFPQRVEIGITEKANVNIFETDGYAFNAGLMTTDYAPELVDMYKANYVHVERRFFGASCPGDLSYDEVKHWEYLTCENSVNDYHSIFTKLKPVLGNKWISFGTDRGGLLTNVYASRYPKDMNLYVSYVAPCANGITDKRFYDFIYNKIGDDAFGEDEASRLRSLVMRFQTELIVNKKELMPSYIDAIDKTGMRFRQNEVPDVLFDLNVLESAAMIWKYSQPFDELKEIIRMPDGTEEEHKAKIQAEFEMMIKLQSPSDWSPDISSWPDYVSAAQETGQYYYDFSYLRDAIDDPDVLEAMSVSRNMEASILWDTVFTQEQRDAFRFTDGFYDGLLSSLKETDAKMLMIYGATDPWISLRLLETGNENIKVYVHPTLPHTASIESFPDETKNEIQQVINSCISKR